MASNYEDEGQEDQETPPVDGEEAHEPPIGIDIDRYQAGEAAGVEEKKKRLDLPEALRQWRQHQSSPPIPASPRAEITPRQAAKATAKAAGQSVVKGGLKTGTRIAAQAGTKAAATLLGTISGAATGGVTTALSLGSLALDSLRQAARSRRFGQVMVLAALFMFGTATIGFAMIAGRKASTDHLGPDGWGGVVPHPQRAAFAAAAAARDGGQAMASTVEAMDASRFALAAVLERNRLKLSPAQITRARQLLEEMHNLRPRLFTAGSVAPAPGEGRQLAANEIARYHHLLRQLYETVYPGAGAAKARVLALVEGGGIRLQTGANCRPVLDLYGPGAPLVPRLLHALASAGEVAAAHNTTLTITCLRTGHDRVEGAARGSRHNYGRAVDIAATAQSATAKAILPYLLENRETLAIDELFFNAPVGDGTSLGYYNIDRGVHVRRPRAVHSGDGHRTHIHLAVKGE